MANGVLTLKFHYSIIYCIQLNITNCNFKFQSEKQACKFSKLIRAQSSGVGW